MDKKYNCSLYLSKLILSLLALVSFLIFLYLFEELTFFSHKYLHSHFFNLCKFFGLGYILFSIINGIVYLYFKRAKGVKILNVMDFTLFLLSTIIGSIITYRSLIPDFGFFYYSAFIVITLYCFSSLLLNNIQDFKKTIDLDNKPHYIYPRLKLFLILLVTLFPLIHLESPKIFVKILLIYILINIAYYFIPWKKKGMAKISLYIVNIVDILLILCCIGYGLAWLFFGVISPDAGDALLVTYLYPTVISIIFLGALSLIFNNRTNIHR